MEGAILVGLIAHIPVILLSCLIWHLILMHKKLIIDFYKLIGYALLVSSVLHIGVCIYIFRTGLNLTGVAYLVVLFLYFLSITLLSIFFGYKLLKRQPIEVNIS